MAELFLKRLVAKGWRGRTFDITFDAPITEIRADNGRGKSTLLHIWLWILTGADIDNRLNYDLYERVEGKEASPDDEGVEGIAYIEKDGAEYCLRRTAKPSWYRPRGKSEYRKSSSDAYKFYIDGVELPAKVYNERVCQLFGDCDMDAIKIMLNPMQYRNLEWRELREMFQRVVGDVRDSDLQGDYSPIADMVRSNGIEASKESLNSRISNLEESKKKLVLERAAQQRQLPDLADVEAAENLIDERQRQIFELDRRLTGLSDAAEPYRRRRMEQMLEIDRLECDMRRAESEWNDAQNAPMAALEREKKEIETENARIAEENARTERLRRQTEALIDAALTDIAYTEKELQRLRDRKEALKAATFAEECPHCGQKMPSDMLAEGRAKFLAANESELRMVVEQGKSLKERQERQQGRIAELKAELDSLPAAQDLKSTEEIDRQIAAAQWNTLPFSDSDRFRELNDRLHELRADLTDIPVPQEASAIEEEKARMLDEMKELMKVAARREARAQGLAAIAEYDKRIAATEAEMIREERRRVLLTEYERERASVISDRANRFLKVAKVEVLKQNKNGKYTDCCQMTIDGVAETANRAAKIRVGVDVATAFQEYFGVTAPVFVDDVDAINEAYIPDIKGQQIRLRYDKAYPELTKV